MKLLESFNIFFRKSGQAILTSDNVLQDVTKGYKRLFLSCQKVSTFFYNTLLKVERGLETWELIMNLSRSFNMLLWKSGQVVITRYNALQRVTNNYIRFRNMETKYKVVKNLQIFSLGKLISSDKKL